MYKLLIKQKGYNMPSPHPTDIEVGRCIRLRRTELGMSQSQLGKTIGVTFQQVQKYESGTNRIGSSRLYEMAQVLGVEVGYFFQNCEGANINDISATTFNTKESKALIKTYWQINKPQIRKQVHQLIKEISSAYKR